MTKLEAALIKLYGPMSVNVSSESLRNRVEDGKSAFALAVEWLESAEAGQFRKRFNEMDGDVPFEDEWADWLRARAKEQTEK